MKEKEKEMCAPHCIRPAADAEYLRQEERSIQQPPSTEIVHESSAAT